MIQDIFPDVYDNQYRSCHPEENSRIIIVKGGRVLAGKSDFPLFSQISSLNAEFRYGFSINSISYFIGFADYEETELFIKRNSEFSFTGLRDFYKYKSKHMAFAAVTAFQLNNWYKGNRFCGRCGHPLIHDKKERMLKCTSCGNSLYPRISPAVIVAVTDGDRILLTKYANREYKRYALIAGFTEIGETVEETVHREVLEEVGIKVKNLRYYKSQPWSFSDTLLMGFFCEPEGSDEIILDTDELSVGKWVNRDELDIEPDGISLTNEMIIRFKNGLE